MAKIEEKIAEIEKDWEEEWGEKIANMIDCSSYREHQWRIARLELARQILDALAGGELTDEEIAKIFNEFYPEVSPFPSKEVPKSYRIVAHAQTIHCNAQKEKEIGEILTLLNKRDVGGINPEWAMSDKDYQALKQGELTKEGNEKRRQLKC